MSAQKGASGGGAVCAFESVSTHVALDGLDLCVRAELHAARHKGKA